MEIVQPGGSGELEIGTTLILNGTNGLFLYDNNGVLGEKSIASLGYITLSSLSAGTGISYDNTTGVITNIAPYTTPLTTKGDILGYDTAPNKIPVGSDNQVLTADSTQALGVKWATLTGGTSTQTPIPNFQGYSQKAINIEGLINGENCGIISGVMSYFLTFSLG